MINVYKKYLIKKFLKKVINVSIVFLFLIVVLNIFEEISFFESTEVNFMIPFFLTFLNSSSILFEIFPFIFLISSLLFFLNLINDNELEVFKVNGLSNLKIIQILFFTSMILGLFLIIFFYSFSSKLKFIYLDMKNNHATDGKYLAMINENGIWIKDEINENIYIVNAKLFNNQKLKTVLITKFNSDYELQNLIKSDLIDISKNEWLIFDPIIVQDHKYIIQDNILKLETHFNFAKINELFSDLTALNIYQLNKLSKDYERLGYSTTEVRVHLNKIYTYPIYFSIMTIFSSIIMLNIKRNRPMIFYLILSIFLSVIIYYLNFLSNLLGENGKVPVVASSLMPLFLLTIIISIGLIRINEK
jgi:lipopolysaccharide export system permease protein